MSRFVLPRYILGNRGDLASRWGVLKTLQLMGEKQVSVFRHAQGDIPETGFPTLDYHPLKNLLQYGEGLRHFRQADTVLWAVGLDMQDDSSLARLMYLWAAFRMYRLMGLKIICLFQGAGPLTTRTGRLIARQVLKQVDTFVARDPGTQKLVSSLLPGLRVIPAHDAIFLPGFEQDTHPMDTTESARLDAFFGSGKAPVIGLNIRQWFHFSSSLLPYQLARKSFQKRSLPRMEELTNSAYRLIDSLRMEHRARILLISAYQPDVLPWEDDLPWLTDLKARFASDNEVILTDGPLTMPAYYAMMKRLDLMIGMRLHSTLIALRFGVPSLNLSYTLKGGDILNALGLGMNVVDLGGFLASPSAALARALDMLSHLPKERQVVEKTVQNAIQVNQKVMQDLLAERS